jgi:hypothetical protein
MEFAIKMSSFSVTLLKIGIKSTAKAILSGKLQPTM